MQLPKDVLDVMARIEENGYECYVVGGCVRDSLLGLEPFDWDICTNALPGDIISLFSDVPCHPTGISHGTVTVVWQDRPFEITTYRTEDMYSDSRHPDGVQFVNSITEDLSRRDFTVNAIAYHPVRGLVDPFGGEEDLRNRLLRCVGVAENRLKEDALRILRGLRFAACYGFEAERDTAQALLSCAAELSHVAAERVQAELSRLLMGTFVGKVLRGFYPIFFHILPELESTLGFEQHSRYHHLDVFQHIVESVSRSRAELPVRLALLFHDIGKPRCFTLDMDGNGHFYGHPAISEELARGILKRLRYDCQTTERVLLLIRYHDTVISPDESSVKRWLRRYGEEFLRQLLLVKEGDSLGHATALTEIRLQELAMIRETMERVVEEQQCFLLKDLAINGNDVMGLGIEEGKRIGEALQWALDRVIEGALPNERETLLDALRKNT